MRSHSSKSRRLALVVGCAVAAVLLPAARGIEARLEVAARVPGSGSATVDALLSERFDSPLARSVVLVLRGVPSPGTAEGQRVLREVRAAVLESEAVRGTLSYLDRGDSTFLPRDGDGTYVVVGLHPDGRPDSLLTVLRQDGDRLATALRARYPAATLRWTGEVALNSDLRRQSAEGVRRAEWRALPLSLGLLLLAFGSPLAAVLPVAAALLAIGLALGASALLTTLFPLSILLQNLVTMLGLGLGIDYALLTVSRFREERAQGAVPAVEAAARAARATGPTILLSGLTVAIGLAALAIVPVSEHRALAVGGLLVVASSVAVATLVLPLLLARVGHRLTHAWPWSARRQTPGGTGWDRWGGFVTRQPWRVLLIGGVPVCLLAAQALRLTITLPPPAQWLPAEMESARALRDLEAMGHGAEAQVLRVVVEPMASAGLFSDTGWAEVRGVQRAIHADSAVARIRSLPQLLGPLAALAPPSRVPALVPPVVLQHHVSRDQRATVFDVVPRDGLSPDALDALVQRLRALEMARVRVQVGGAPALTVDYRAAVAGRFAHVVALITGITFVVLAISLRSLLVPLKALLLNLLAVAAAFGVLTLMFQDGLGVALLGLTAPTGGVFAAIPTLVFCTVFGLSMDYEVFLIARVREARATGASELDAVRTGLARTGGVITHAAAIMVVVFGAFSASAFLPVQMLGVGLATAVLLDATVMRLALSPALLVLAGRWNWWPGDRRGATVSPPLAPTSSPSGHASPAADR